MNEIWKDILGYEGLYQISNLGNVKSIRRKCKKWNGVRTVSERILKTSNNTWGYPSVTLCKNDKKKTYTIHTLVANAFIPNPDNLSQVNHKDENKANNAVENLEWCTMEYNNDYGTRVERGIKTRNKSVLCIETGIIYPSATEVEKLFGFRQANISICCLGKKGHHTAYGYHWKYIE